MGQKTLSTWQQMAELADTGADHVQVRNVLHHGQGLPNKQLTSLYNQLEHNCQSVPSSCGRIYFWSLYPLLCPQKIIE